jgi:hypothetical protein
MSVCESTLRSWVLRQHNYRRCVAGTDLSIVGVYSRRAFPLGLDHHWLRKSRSAIAAANTVRMEPITVQSLGLALASSPSHSSVLAVHKDRVMPRVRCVSEPPHDQALLQQILRRHHYSLDRAAGIGLAERLPAVRLQSACPSSSRPRQSKR